MKMSQARQQLANEAARIMEEEGVHDFHKAKRKASQRLGISGRDAMPSNQEIETALREYQSIFRADSHDEHLRYLRQTALQAMKFFMDFSPKLAGPVADGTATQFAGITLHLFASSSEEVNIFLMNHNIPFDMADVSLNAYNGTRQVYPAYKFFAGEVPVELVVFTDESGKHPPRSPVDGKSMKRLGVKELESLLTS